MTLSPTVARTGGREMIPRKRQSDGPFGGMNQTMARMERAPNPRSRAAQQRSHRESKIRHSGPPDQKREGELYHALKMQRALNPVSYASRERTKARIADVDSFDQFGLLPTVRDAVRERILPDKEELVPSPVQRLAIPALLGHGGGERRRSRAVAKDGLQEFLLAAETGSGKTLAYALPILDAIKRAEAVEKEEEEARQQAVKRRMEADPHYVEPPPLHDLTNATSGRPRAIILVPSAELVSQVWSVFKALAYTIKIRSDGISAAVAPKVIRRRVFQPEGLDVLVSTPHLLASLSLSDPNVLSRVRHLVVDEADSLLDRCFAPSTVAIIDKCRPSLQQLVFCSATIPRSLDAALRERFPNIKRLVTPNLHAVPRRVTLGVVDIERQPYVGNRALACADTIDKIGKAGFDAASGDELDPADRKRILVFVNERERTVEVAKYLQRKGIDAAALNRDTPEPRKAAILTEFTVNQFQGRRDAPESLSLLQGQPAPASETGNDEAVTNRRHERRTARANTKVLVTTDLASRGIDTLAVRNVILYDVPHTTIDFIHRLGRTGRMKARGRGVVLVGKRDRRDVVREVRDGMFRGQALV